MEVSEGMAIPSLGYEGTLKLMYSTALVTYIHNSAVTEYYHGHNLYIDQMGQMCLLLRNFHIAHKKKAL